MRTIILLIITKTLMLIPIMLSIIFDPVMLFAEIVFLPASVIIFLKIHKKYNTGRLDSNDSYLTFKIKNNSDKKGKARLLGGMQSLEDSFNEKQKIDVKVAESSHFEAKTAMLAKSYLVNKMCFVLSEKHERAFTIIHSKETGYCREHNILLGKFGTENYNGFKECVKQKVILDAGTSFEITVYPFEEITIRFYISGRILLSNIHRNKPILETL